MKDIFGWCKLFVWKSTVKWWISSYSSSKTLLKCLRQKMPCPLQLFLIYFCLRRKSSNPYPTKWLSFTLYTNARNLSFLDAKMLKSISKESTLESALKTYKGPIKLLKLLHCHCRLSKTYINSVGFLQVSN